MKMKFRYLLLLLSLAVFSTCTIADDPGVINEESNRTSIPDPVFEQFLIDQGYDDILDGSIDTSEISEIEVLDMSDIPVTMLIGLEDFTALRKFLVRSSDLESFDPTPNVNLTYLSTNGCRNLQALDVSSLTKLDTLYMSNNNSIISLDVSQNIDLKSLHVIAENLETIIFPQAQTSQFIDLILFNTKVNAVDLAPFEELELLRIDANRLTNLDLTANPNLLEIDCSGNPLTSLNLANGMNELIQTMNATETNLECIQIDQGFQPPSDGSWQIDPDTVYSDSCG